MNRLGGWKTGPALFVMWVVAVIAAPAQTFTALLSFNDATGGNPGPGSLAQGIDGNLYGTAFYGGPEGEGDGTVFKITPTETLSMLHYFHGTADGSHPSEVVLGLNGNLYGTTQEGGAQSPTCNVTDGCGTVFGFTSAGTLFTLHTFNGLDGAFPTALTLGNDGNFYGTAQASASGCQCGTIFKITPTGAFTLLHTFGNTDGTDPQAPLVQATNGNFYGMTVAGGLYGYGTVFEITPGGTFTTIHNFDNSDGATPFGGLVQATNGYLYGATSAGGRPGNGTIFLVSPGGRTFQRLYEFTGGSDGSAPITGLVLGADGNFYGATHLSTAACDCGTIFEITPSGILTTLHTFDGTDGGAWPTLMQDTSGTFYGTTLSFGANYNCPENGCGTAFSLSTGLGPFVTAVPASRGIGARVIILGQGLTGATSVTFNGVTAQFTVNSDTEITTSVPVGAKTGSVQVTTPTGTLSTKVVFVVG